MSRRGARRVVSRPVAIIILAVLLIAAGVAVLGILKWPFKPDPNSVEQRLESAVLAAEVHRERVEARLRLQLLAGAMERGRRSAALRPSYRLLEDMLDRVAAGSDPELGVLIQAEMEGLLADLSRDRASARNRIQSLVAALSSPAGPGRQGDAL